MKLPIWVWVVGALILAGMIGVIFDPSKNSPTTQKIGSGPTSRGPKPTFVAGSGLACKEVTDYLRENVHDFAHIEMYGASDVSEYQTDAWAQSVKYGAKNPFGGVEIISKTFVIKDGKVIDTVDKH